MAISWLNELVSSVKECRVEVRDVFPRRNTISDMHRFGGAMFMF